jgi:Mg2+ and Co2+ transporter CorA
MATTRAAPPRRTKRSTRVRPADRSADGADLAERSPRRGPGASIHGVLYDARGEDREVEVTEAVVARLRDDQLLWIDTERPDEPTLDVIDRLLALQAPLSAALRTRGPRPGVHIAGDDLVVHVTSLARDNGHERGVNLSVAAGRNVVASIREAPIPLLDEFRDHAMETPIGRVTSATFLAALLDWLVSGYFRVIDELEDEADRLDQHALNPRSERDLLSDLIRVRRRITAVRRIVGPHREAFAALAAPDLAAFGDAAVTPHFQALAGRLDRALDEIETARQLVLGTFDVHMTQTAQRTNDVMKILTVTTVVLLPASVIAGIMGMNFQPAFFSDEQLYWVLLAVMAAIALGTLVFARLRRWI